MTSEPYFEVEVFSWVENLGENLLTGGDLGNTGTRVFELPSYLGGQFPDQPEFIPTSSFL